MFHEVSGEWPGTHFFQFQLRRQNRFIDFLERELETADTRAEVEVLQSILCHTSRQVDDLMTEFIRCRAGRAGHEQRFTDARSHERE